MVLLVMYAVTNIIKYLAQILFIIVEVCIKFNAKLSSMVILKCSLRLKVRKCYIPCFCNGLTS